MAEDTEGQQDGDGAAESDADAATPDDAGDAASNVAGKAKEAADGNGMTGKVLIGAAIAGATVAAGYAATKAAPKLKESATSKATEAAGDVAGDVAEKAEDQGGPLGLAAKVAKKGGDSEGSGLAGAVKGMVPGVGGGKKKEPSQGWGKGRRNPIQRWVDVAVPVETAYNQWTQFEEFPKFMHRVVSVQQDENERQKIKWREKIWFKTRDWEAQITEQIPDKRIAWKTMSGTSHTGHISFHRLDDELTRVLLTVDFNPSGMFEKMASGLRFVKRAAESDLCRFKAFIEMHQEATGAWRGRIEDGEVVEDPGVEEGKPFEEGEELRKPESASKDDDEKEKDKDDGDSDQGEDEQPRAEADGGDESSDDRSEEREERARRREERQAAAASS